MFNPLGSTQLRQDALSRLLLSKLRDALRGLSAHIAGLHALTSPKGVERDGAGLRFGSPGLGDASRCLYGWATFAIMAQVQFLQWPWMDS